MSTRITIQEPDKITVVKTADLSPARIAINQIAGTKITIGAIVGPKGEQGDQGDVGPQGPQGDPGLSGGLNNYVKVLPAGTAITILPAEHLLASVSGVTVLTGDEQEVDVYKELQADKTVIIQTNLSFENYKVTIF